MKLSLLVSTVAIIVAAAASEAHACGVWHLQDTELGRKVTFYVENVLITLPRGQRGPRKMILRVSGRSADDMHSKLGRRKHMYFEGDALKRRGKVIGTLEGHSVTIRNKTFKIGLTYHHDWGGMQRWEVKITRGERVVATGKAMAMCMGGLAPPSDKPDPARQAKAEQEIRRRVILYLAWRQLVRRR